MPTEPTLRSRIGSPVCGPDFWPRPDVVETLFEDLTEGRSSRRLFALRRIGKTSVLLELERRLKAAGTVVVHCDVQGLHRFRDFLTKVVEQLPSGGRFDELRKRVANNPVLRTAVAGMWSRVTGGNAPAPAGFLNEFDHSAAWSGDIKTALKAAGPIVLFLDELPFMLRNMMAGEYKPVDAERFLATLRDWRMNCGVRMLLSGSLGFAQLARHHQIAVADHIGDVPPALLPPLGRDEAIAMVEALARGEHATDWTPALSAAIVDASAETWPIFLQYGFSAVVRAKVRDPAKVPAAIDAGVRQALDETFYQQFTIRLSRYGEDESPARHVLRTVMAAGDAPAPFAAIDAALEKHHALERRDDLLEALREDDFIMFDTETQTIRPASRLVPVWVRARAWGR